MNLVFLGPPGAGKGTIAKVAKEALGVPHISTGDLFRANIKNETELGKRVKEILASGGLVPDEITIKMVENRLSESDCEKGYILDGFPRTIPQAEALSKMSNVEGVINFVLSEEEIIKRLSGRRMCPSTGRTYHILFNPPKVEGIDDETGEPLIQRDDDKPEAIRHRLELYNEATAPLIDYYKAKDVVLDLICTNDPKETEDNFFALIKDRK
ncbi:MAG: adenylate kinase [Candidatus Ornithospirochaeta sp.]|nr:adenylate kinase [Sphaerochaetaceae bacterium]MDY5522880.1 adenylate kinase [Candidatus Ornithospirochaeta sp.]